MYWENTPLFHWPKSLVDYDRGHWIFVLFIIRTFLYMKLLITYSHLSLRNNLAILSNTLQSSLSALLQLVVWNYMMTSSNGNIFRVTGHLWGESTRQSTSHRWIPHKGQWRGVLMFSLICACRNVWAWFETPSRSLWRHVNGSNIPILNIYSYPSAHLIL